MPEPLTIEALHLLLERGAWPKPGALLFCVAPAARAQAFRERLTPSRRAWVGWRQRDALLRSWRPAAQERYHSVAGRDAPTLEAWLEPAFSAWPPGPDGTRRMAADRGRMERALDLCALRPLTLRPMSLLSNGESARACLAAALGPSPEILVLDDLCEGLDAEGRATLLRAAQALASEGRAVLFLASRESLLPGSRTAAKPAPHFNAAATRGGAELFACSGLDLYAGDKPLVLGLDWTVREGEAWALSGPNGAGKSSLLAYLSGEHPQAWARSWSLKGQDRFAWTPLDRLRQEIAWVSPELAAAADRKLSELLDKALAGPAKLLLLDEALRGLDAVGLERVESKLTEALRAKPFLGLVFVSHDPSELPTWINRSLRLKGGGKWESD